MKKSDFILIGIVLLVTVLAIFSSKGNIELEEVDYPLTLVGDVGLHQITYDEYKTKVDNVKIAIVCFNYIFVWFCICGACYSGLCLGW